MVIILGTNAYFDATNQDHELDYLAAIKDKEASVLACNTSKILLIGGSNVAYGFDSDMITASTGLETFNLGLQYSLGLNFILNQAKALAKPGDTIILSPEYFIENDGEAESVMKILSYYPKAYDYIAYTNPLHFLADWMIYKINRTKYYFFSGNKKRDFGNVSDTTNVFFRAAFNKRGDLISHLNNPPKPFQPMEVDFAELFDPELDKIVAFAAYCQKNHIRFYYTYPPFENTPTELKRWQMGRRFNSLRATKKIQWLDTPYNNLYDKEYFFDHANHLNASGRALHTRQLILKLKVKKNEV